MSNTTAVPIPTAINWRHPSARGLLAALPLNDMSIDAARDYAGHQKYSPVSITTADTVTTSPWGRAYANPAQNRYWQSPNIGGATFASIPTQFTLAARVMLTANNLVALLSFSGGGSGVCYFGTAGGTNWETLDNNGNTGVAGGTPSLTIPSNVVYRCNALGTKMDFFVNGAKSTMSAIFNPGNGTFFLSIGAYNGTNFFSGTMSDVRFWKRAISDAEAFRYCEEGPVPFWSGSRAAALPRGASTLFGDMFMPFLGPAFQP
jgi:Concanavalin A-like lectin/glucanases superfamily